MRRGCGWGKQNIEQAFFGVQFSFVGDVFEFLFANVVNRDLQQIADHRLDIAAYVTDFGEL